MNPWTIAFLLLAALVLAIEARRRWRTRLLARPLGPLPPVRVVRPISLYLDGQKLGELTASSITLDHKHPKGNIPFISVFIVADTLIPVETPSVNLLDAFIKQRRVKAFFMLSGKGYNVMGIITRAVVTSDFESGLAKGCFEFRGDTSSLKLDVSESMEPTVPAPIGQA